MNDSHRYQPVRRAVTLVELLVVVTIMLLLAAFAIPTIRPMTEGRRIREAARAIDVYLTQAKTRALVVQRPVGVVLERFQQVDTSGTSLYLDDTCTVLRMVEIPPPYAGDFTDSRLRVQNWTYMNNGTTPHTYYNSGSINYFVIKIALPSACLSGRLLKRGDKVRFNFQGPMFTLVDDPWDTDASSDGADIPVDVDGYIDFDTANINTQVLTAIAPVGQLGGLSWPLVPDSTVDPTRLTYSSRPVWSADLTFQFFRQPEPSPGDPLRLPKNTVIDLADSGYYPALAGPPDAFDCITATDQRGPMILFAPNGAISHVYHWDSATANYGATSVMNPIFLMVGKWERTGLNADGTSYADDGLHNWQDASNLWISIGPQNGFVTTAEVNADSATAAGVNVPSTLDVSRTYARQKQISKGAL